MALKLTYFDIWGRAEGARMTAGCGGVEFEDNRLPSMEAWGALKASGFSPSGQIPVLEVGDVKLTQSHAMVRFFGKKGGLYPEDALAAAKVDMLIFQFEDTCK